MKRTSIVVFAFTLASALMVTGARAQDYAGSGWYVGAQGTYAIENFDDDGFDFDDAGGFNVRLGMRAHPNVALELEYEWLDEFEGDFGVEVDGWVLTANGKGYLLTGPLQPYVLLGLGVVSGEAEVGGSDVDEEAFGVRVGGGLEFYLTETFALALESTYVIPTDDLEDFQFVTVSGGITIRQ